MPAEAATSNHLAPGETVIYEARPDGRTMMKRALLISGVLVLYAALIGELLAVGVFGAIQPNAPMLLGQFVALMVLIAFVAGAILFAASCIGEYLTAAYVVTNYSVRVERRHGVVAFRIDSLPLSAVSRVEAGIGWGRAGFVSVEAGRRQLMWHALADAGSALAAIDGARNGAPRAPA